MRLKIISVLFLLIYPLGSINFRQTAFIPVGVEGCYGSVKGFDANHNGSGDLIFAALYATPPLRYYTAYYEYSPWNRFILKDSITPINCDNPWDIGYLDNDSLTDVVCQHYDPDSLKSAIRVYESPHYYAYPTRLAWEWIYEFNGGAASQMVIADLDRDGHKDILTSDCYILYVFENIGDNNYRKVYWDTVWFSIGFGFGAIADFDHDGKVEFAFKTRNYVSVYECLSDNLYDEVFRDTLPRIQNRNGVDLCTGNDLDGDGKEEIIIGCYGDPSEYYLWIYEAVGDNQYEIAFRDSFYPAVGVWNGIEQSSCGDLDSDGKDEIVWAVRGNWLVYRATGNNTYERIFRAYPIWNRHFTTQTCIYDLNGNGYPEIVESGDSAYGGGGITRTVIWEIEGVRLHRPNGGEILQPGSQFPITWEKFTPPGADSFTLFVSFNNGLDYRTITTIRQSDDTVYVWSVPDSLSDSCKIMIWAYGPPRAGENKPRGTAWDFSDSTFSIKQTGVREVASSEERVARLKILQNPARGEIRLQITDNRSQKIGLKIYDVCGKMVKDIVFRPSEDGRYRTIVLNPGVYFVRFESKDKIITKKVVVIE